MAFPRPHVIKPTSQHTHTIIFIHGRDSDGEELAEQLFEGKTSTGLTLNAAVPSSKWIFPSARERYSTVFQENLTEWFDIYSLTDPDFERERQVDTLKESVEYIHRLIEDESKIIPSQNIILAGMSRGFAVASHVLLSSHCRLGGFIGLCGWVPFRTELETVIRKELTLPAFFEQHIGLARSAPAIPAVGNIPVFFGHAKGDSVVDFKHGVDACKTFRALGMDNVEFHAYDDHEHWISEPQGFDDLVTWLVASLV